MKNRKNIKMVSHSNIMAAIFIATKNMIKTIKTIMSLYFIFHPINK